MREQQDAVIAVHNVAPLRGTGAWKEALAATQRAMELCGVAWIDSLTKVHTAHVKVQKAVLSAYSLAEAKALRTVIPSPGDDEIEAGMRAARE